MAEFCIRTPSYFKDSNDVSSDEDNYKYLYTDEEKDDPEEEDMEENVDFIVRHLENIEMEEEDLMENRNKLIKELEKMIKHLENKKAILVTTSPSRSLYKETTNDIHDLEKEIKWLDQEIKHSDDNLKDLDERRGTVEYELKELKKDHKRKRRQREYYREYSFLYSHHIRNVKEDGENLKLVPENMRDKKMCLAAVNAKQKCLLALKYFPERHMKENILLPILENNWVAGKYIEHRFFTPKMCYASIKNNAAAIEDVPKSLLTSNIMLMAILTHTRETIDIFYMILKRVPSLLTKEICDAALKLDPNIKECIPAEFRQVTN